jgi:hypothetical protein
LTRLWQLKAKINIEINIWKRNSTVKNFPIRAEFRSVFNAFDQSFDQFYCLFFSVEFLFHIFISMKIKHLFLRFINCFTDYRLYDKTYDGFLPSQSLANNKTLIRFLCRQFRRYILFFFRTNYNRNCRHKKLSRLFAKGPKTISELTPFSSQFPNILYVAVKLKHVNDCTAETRKKFTLNPRNPTFKYTKARNPKETCTRITKTQRVKRPKAYA